MSFQQFQSFYLGENTSRSFFYYQKTPYYLGKHHIIEIINEILEGPADP